MVKIGDIVKHCASEIGLAIVIKVYFDGGLEFLSIKTGYIQKSAIKYENVYWTKL